MKYQNILKSIAEISENGEIFRQIPYAPDYFISNLGRVFGTTYCKILKPEHKNYSRVFIKTIQGVYKHFQLHRIVAELFCLKAEGQTIVHHINKDSADNRAVNLVWVTFSQHMTIHRNFRKNSIDERKAV